MRYKEKQDEKSGMNFILRTWMLVRVPFGVCFKPAKLPCPPADKATALTVPTSCTAGQYAREYEKEIEKRSGEHS